MHGADWVPTLPYSWMAIDGSNPTVPPDGGKKPPDLFLLLAHQSRSRFRGTLMAVNQQILDPEQVKQCAYSLMSQIRIARFSRSWR